MCVLCSALGLAIENLENDLLRRWASGEGGTASAAALPAVLVAAAAAAAALVTALAATALAAAAFSTRPLLRTLFLMLILLLPSPSLPPCSFWLSLERGAAAMISSATSGDTDAVQQLLTYAPHMKDKLLASRDEEHGCTPLM